MDPDPGASGTDGPLLVQPSVELKLAPPPPSRPRTHCGSESASMRSDAAKVAPVAAAGPCACSDGTDGGTYIGGRRSSAGKPAASGADAGGINPAACPCERSQSGSAPSSTKLPAESCDEPGAAEAGPQLVALVAGAGSGPTGGDGAMPQPPGAACEPGPENIGAAGVAGAAG